MPIRFPREGNDLWPLPVDYPDLTAGGQRLARRNVIEAQILSPEDLVAAWSFFRGHYLDWEGGGFYKRKLPSPPFHAQMVYWAGRYSSNAIAAPRASAKTTMAKEIQMLGAIGRRRFTTLYCSSTQARVQRYISDIRWQVLNNQRLYDDFGELAPKRGEGMFSTMNLQLSNGSELIGLPIKGRARGERPDLIVLDDVEHDPEVKEDKADAQKELTDQFKAKLMSVWLPMLEQGCGIFIIGTLVARRLFLFTICQGEDPRFKFFNRVIFAAEGDNGELLWPDKWPREVLDSWRERLGVGPYESEFRNNPGSGSSRTLALHPQTDQYMVEEIDEAYSSRPLSSQAKLVTWSMTTNNEGIPSYNREEQPFGEAVSKMHRYMTHDPTRSEGPDSDFGVLSVWGLDTNNCLWVLDLWVERKRDLSLKLWELAAKWRVKAVGIESVGDQIYVVDRIAAESVRFAAKYQGYYPRVVSLKWPPHLEKGDRIDQSRWRFGTGRIKYPMHLKGKWPFSELYRQTELFTPDLSLLRHDDVVDAVLGMPQFLVRAKPHRDSVGITEDERDPLEVLKSGKLDMPGTPGAKAIMALSASEIPVDLAVAALEKHKERVEAARRKRANLLTRSGPRKSIFR